MIDYLITPSPELREQWLQSPHDALVQAAQWGADQELEACFKWTAERTTQWSDGTWPADALRAARRPKPPSLREQALMALEDGDIGPGASLTPVEVCIIRRALEALPND